MSQGETAEREMSVEEALQEGRAAGIREERARLIKSEDARQKILEAQALQPSSEVVDGFKFLVPHAEVKKELKRKLDEVEEKLEKASRLVKTPLEFTDTEKALRETEMETLKERVEGLRALWRGVIEKDYMLGVEDVLGLYASEARVRGPIGAL